MYVQNRLRTKLDEMSRACLFVRYTEKQRNYGFFDFETGKLWSVERPNFYEFKKFSKTSEAITETIVFDIFLPEDIIAVEIVNQTDRDAGNEHQDQISANQNNPTNGNDSLEPATVQHVRSSGSFRETPLRLGFEPTLTVVEDADVSDMFVAHEPHSYREEVEDIQKEKWEDAMVK